MQNVPIIWTKNGFYTKVSLIGNKLWSQKMDLIKDSRRWRTKTAWRHFFVPLQTVKLRFPLLLFLFLPALTLATHSSAFCTAHLAEKGLEEKKHVSKMVPGRFLLRKIWKWKSTKVLIVIDNACGHCADHLVFNDWTKIMQLSPDCAAVRKPFKMNIIAMIKKENYRAVNITFQMVRK